MPVTVLAPWERKDCAQSFVCRVLHVVCGTSSLLPPHAMESTRMPPLADVVDWIAKCTSKHVIVFHVDESQALKGHPQYLADLFDLFAACWAHFQREQSATYPLLAVSGTMATVVRQAADRSRVGPVSVALSHLTLEQINVIVDFVAGEHVEMSPILCALFELTDGIPRFAASCTMF